MSTAYIGTNGTSTAEGLEISADASTRVPTPTAMTMDPDGDLILRVGSDSAANNTYFKVCSAALRRNSPVFKAMLYGLWAESKPQNDSETQWLVSLPDEEPSAMRVILDIVHGNFDKVPYCPWEPVLYEVVVLADKYDMFKCLIPWAEYWRRVVVQNLNEYGKPFMVHVA
jgi:hypothetical protein